jgi:transposase-like protein
MRVFSTAFKEAAVVRLAAGERLAAVARELGIARKLLYEWRAAHRRFGVAGLNRRRGPKPRSARASPDATPAALSELARAQARIAELERKIGRQAIDLDFFREALRLIDARDPSSRATPSTRSSKR